MAEVRTVASSGGEKGMKDARFDLIPVGPLTEVAKLYGFGASKYADRNWERGYEWSKSYAALLRHVTQFWDGEDIDDESRLSHLASVVFHAFAMMEWIKTHPEFDDRPTLERRMIAAANRELTSTGIVATAVWIGPNDPRFQDPSSFGGV